MCISLVINTLQYDARYTRRQRVMDIWSYLWNGFISFLFIWCQFVCEKYKYCNKLYRICLEDRPIFRKKGNTHVIVTVRVCMYLRASTPQEDLRCVAVLRNEDSDQLFSVFFITLCLGLSHVISSVLHCNLN